MKQVLQSFETGEVELAEIPTPRPAPGKILIRTQASLISAGTERMLLEFGRAGLLAKARQQPDKVKQVIEKVQVDGLLPTMKAVRSKLSTPTPLGYCNAGYVIEVGAGVKGFLRGDRVVSNGPHSEVVCVPKNLCAKIPAHADEISFEEATFTPLAAIALQGIRLLQPTLGERFAVIGQGLVGLLATQLLRAHGCQVLATDLDPEKLEVARQFGALTVDLSSGEDPIKAAEAFTSGNGLDGVLIAASTESSEPLHHAATMCRKRGRIVLTGVIGNEFSRADFYEKELSFQVSCSYGPGRYDPSYEEDGHDYPLGYLRWTEQRNFEAILQMLGERKLDVAPLIRSRFPLEEAVKGYEALLGSRDALGIVLGYPAVAPGSLGAVPSDHVLRFRDRAREKKYCPSVGVIGAGNFSSQILLPALKKTHADLRVIASVGGVSGAIAGRKFGFEEATTDADRIFSDSSIDTVAVLTQHGSHARFVEQALRAGKNVFVEKPLAITRDELKRVRSLCEELDGEGVLPLIGIGFNRRFSQLTQRMKVLADSVPGPKTMIYTVNAGDIPPASWVHDPRKGGGRILGEGCHFVDLLRFLAGSRIKKTQAMRIGEDPKGLTEDKATITLLFENGSLGTIHYFSNGHKSFPKERIELFASGRILALDNFRSLTGYGWPKFKRLRLHNQDKGHEGGIKAFIDSIREGTPAPIPVEEIFEVTERMFDIDESAEHA